MGQAVFFIILIALLVLEIAAMWKIFQKAGQPGWASIIPIYGAIVFLKIVGRPWWWLLLFLIPIVGLVLEIIAINDLSKSFGKGPGFTVGIILLAFVFIPILGFGDAQYRGPGAQLPSY